MFLQCNRTINVFFFSKIYAKRGWLNNVSGVCFVNDSWLPIGQKCLFVDFFCHLRLYLIAWRNLQNVTRRCYKMNNLFLHFLHKHLPIGWVIISINVPVVKIYKLLKETWMWKLGLRLAQFLFLGVHKSDFLCCVVCRGRPREKRGGGN